MVVKSYAASVFVGDQEIGGPYVKIGGSYVNGDLACKMLKKLGEEFVWGLE